MCACTRRMSLLALVLAGAALALAAGDVPALPALRCPTDATEDQCLKISSYKFIVEGSELRLSYEDDNLLRLECSYNLHLDSSLEYLPAFTSTLHVGNVMVVGCPPPHYAAVFAALNVTPTSPFNLKLYETKQTLKAAYFTDLPPHLHLMLQGKGVLHDLPASLEVLTVDDMKVPNEILEALPRTLTELRMEGVNVTRIPAAVLELPELRSLRVSTEPAKIDEVVLERSTKSGLQQLYLAGADAALLNEWAPPALEEVSLWYWQAVIPNPLPTCEKLVNLTLYYRSVTSLPADWMARCPRLEMLQITVMPRHLTELPARLLGNATQLTNFGIRGTNISSLPAQLFADTRRLTHLNLGSNSLKQLPPQLLEHTPHLTHLDLSSNQIEEIPPQLLASTSHLTHLNLKANYLTELPPNIFAETPHLTYLCLDSNRLTGLPAEIFANTPHLTHLDFNNNRLAQLPSAILKLPLLSLDLGFNEFDTSVVAKVATLTELRSLSLAWNREIGDLCEVFAGNNPGKSQLASLSKLERLELQRTEISNICRDWREDMVNLTYLDLSNTKTTELRHRDLRYKRNAPTVVKLSGTVSFTAHDFDRAAAAAAVSLARYVTVTLSTHSSYDCSLYWLTNALNRDLLPLDDVVVDSIYIHGVSLRTVRAEDLLCPKKETCATVPSGCYCGMAGGRLLRVVCVGVKLDHVPRLPSLDNATNVHAVDLVLSDNSITELVADDIPPHLRVLDLRNNSISYITEATARALVSGTKRRVLLAGNRLECSCRATPALRVLRDHAAALVGYDALRCEDGKTLEDAIDACSTPAALL